jgi:hypothetical protein
MEAVWSEDLDDEFKARQAERFARTWEIYTSITDELCRGFTLDEDDT